MEYYTSFSNRNQVYGENLDNMSFCSLSPEFSGRSRTEVENAFFAKYMPTAAGNAVKVYLYGLYLCSQQAPFAVERLAEELALSVSEVKEAFAFWEDYGIVSVLSQDPFTVQYLPCDYSYGKPKRIRAEKYTDFCKALQSIFPEKEISVSEYGNYMKFLEEQPIKPEALLMIAQYCKDYTQDKSLSAKYILSAAQNFVKRGITTEKQIEQEISFYMEGWTELKELFAALHLRRKADVTDSESLKRWKSQLDFEFPAIRYAASRLKHGSMEALDALLKELYANKCFSKEEIDVYLTSKEQIRSITLAVGKQLGVYMPVVETYSETYVSVWLSLGYTGECLQILADYAFRRGKKSFESMDELIHELYDMGVVSYESIGDYLRSAAEDDRFLMKFLSVCAIRRRPNNWDRASLKSWRSWGFTDEMILKAAQAAVGKMNPVPYVGSVLSDWKAKHIFSPQDIPQAPHAGSPSEIEHKRVTSKEEMTQLLKELDKLEF